MPVSINDGDEVLGIGVADIFDSEVVHQRAGRGIPGFCIKLSRLPKGRYPIALTLKAGGGPLLGTPLAIDDPAQLELVFSSDAAVYEGKVSALSDELVSLRSEVARLSQQLSQVTSPQGDFQSMVITVLSERMAALAEIQREAVERELDALRSFAFNNTISSATTIALQAEPALAAEGNSSERARAIPSRVGRLKRSGE